jgi:hypothetical protein
MQLIAAFCPEMNEAPAANRPLVYAHASGNTWEIFWDVSNGAVAVDELKRLRIKPKKQFVTSAEDYRCPAGFQEFVVARITTAAADKLLTSSLAQMFSPLD